MNEESARYDPGDTQQWVRAMAGGDRDQRDSRPSSKDWRAIAVLVERIQADLNTLGDTVLAEACESHTGLETIGGDLQRDEAGETGGERCPRS